MTTILLVGNSTPDQRRAEKILREQRNWTVVLAGSGQDALRQMEQQLPDLVVAGLEMPGMNGLDFINLMRLAFPLVPVILITAATSEDVAVAALKQGAASYVSRDRLVPDLNETVQFVLTASQRDRGKSRLMTHRLTKTESSFVLENDPTLIPPLISHLQQTMRMMQLGSEAERLRVGIALEEALLNAYYHGNLEVSSQLRENDHKAFYELARKRAREAPYRDRCIYVSAKLSHPESVYTIRDEGPGFDLSALPDPTDPAHLERPCGRGLLLMRTFMDEVQHNEIGNEVVLIKRRAGQHTGKLVGERV